MKVLIYIPKTIKEIENCKNCPLAIQGVCAALRETAPKEGKRVNCPVMAEISDNATNGEVIKALFPHGRQEAREPIMRFMVDNYAYEFSYKWWNTPHKAESEVKMSDKEKEKFREHMNKFSREQILGWMAAISFILPIDEVNPELRDKLVKMFDICNAVIDERDYPR